MRYPMVALLLLGLVSASANAAEPMVVEVWKNPACGCCAKWIEHLQQNGFRTQVHLTEDTSSARSRLGVPAPLGACHSALVGGYFVEGHVPAQDVQRLLLEKPQAKGLSVPSMPPGSPGMEGMAAVPYNSLLVLADGSVQVFARH